MLLTDEPTVHLLTLYFLRQDLTDLLMPDLTSLCSQGQLELLIILSQPHCTWIAVMNHQAGLYSLLLTILALLIENTFLKDCFESSKNKNINQLCVCVSSIEYWFICYTHSTTTLPWFLWSLEFREHTASKWVLIFKRQFQPGMPFKFPSVL